MNNPLTPSPSIAIESSSKRARQIPILLGVIGLLQFFLYIDFPDSAIASSLVWAASCFSLAFFISTLENKKKFNVRVDRLKEKVLFRAIIFLNALLLATTLFIHYQFGNSGGDGFGAIESIIFGLLFGYGILFGAFTAAFSFIQTRYAITFSMMRLRMIVTFSAPVLAFIWLIFA